MREASNGYNNNADAGCRHVLSIHCTGNLNARVQLFDREQRDIVMAMEIPARPVAAMEMDGDGVNPISVSSTVDHLALAKMHGKILYLLPVGRVDLKLDMA